ncbi:MAG: RecX family transcriptional regulator [Anaerolineaceae bacterium]|nr:RecX family transcriptional regulator [Anaerolineaceae bacterium]
MDQKITALKAQKRNPNRINIYLDGIFAFGLARVVAAWLQVGQILSDEKINALQNEDTFEVAYQKSLNLLGYRPRSENEVRRKLIEKGFSGEVIGSVLERLKTSGLIEDRQFAKIWIENRAAFRPRSHRLMAIELRQKGVTDDAIQEALDSSVDDATLAYEAAVRYSRRLSGLEWGEFRERMSAYLRRRGFSYGTITVVVQRLWSEMKPTEGTYHKNYEELKEDGSDSNN